MNDSRRRDFLKVAGGVAVVGGLAGCAGEAQEEGEGEQQQEEEPGGGQEEEPPAEEEEPQEEEEEEQQEATGDDMIRLAHMIPDFPAVDVYIDDGEEPAVSGLSYTDTTDYIDLAAGQHQIRVTAAGGRSLVVFDQQVEIPAGNTTAVALAEPEGGMENGQQGGGQQEGGQQEGGQQGATQQGGQSIGFQLELYQDDNSPPEETINTSRLRLIHASPDAPAVDVTVGQTTVFENVGFAEAGYFDLPAGDYEFNILPADAQTGGQSEGEAGGGSEDGGGGGGGLFSDLAATDGGADISLLQEDGDGNQTDEGQPPEEGEEEGEPEVEPVFTFDASLDENAVYTAYATGYLDPEAANSDEEFQVVITQDVVDGDVVEADDDDE